MVQVVTFEQKLQRALTNASKASGTSDFDLNLNTVWPDQDLRAAAVLLAFQNINGQWHLILTKRPSTMKHHPGQIALPGGKVETSDDDAQSAALREASEEIGLDPNQVNIMGGLPHHRTVTAFDVHPFVGVVDTDFIPKPDPHEVEEIFYVPVSHVFNPCVYQIQERLWKGILRRYFSAAYGPYFIWGATARILRILADNMDETT